MDISVSSPTRMTLFYITSETLDEDQLAIAKKFYGDFVPQYTYIGHMGLPSESDRTPLFVWRIVCPAGRPFAADGRRLGLRANRGKYVGILKHFVDFAFEPLQLADGDCPSDEHWPMVLHNPRLDAHNIIVRHDWSGIAGVLLWTAPPVLTLPFGASLCGLLFLLFLGGGRPDNVEDECTDEEGEDTDEEDECIDEEGEDTDKEDECIDEEGEDTDEEDELIDEEGNPLWSAGPWFTGYSRDEYELQRVSMYCVLEKESKLMNDPKLCRRLFAAMMQGFAVANASDVYKKCYKRHVNWLMWDWFHFEMDPRVSDENAVVHAESVWKGESVAAANVNDFNKKCYKRHVNQLIWDWFYPEMDSRVSDEKGVAAANASDLHKKYYERRVNQLIWDWFYCEIDSRVSYEKAVVCAGNGDKGEDSDVDMDRD
ncbi:MAG: hypothetical protein M1822_009571 [Bathelium mastoideum]|nr:MAG: hypothetical protein M1822_009571 [Bathelium mastoideum]